jgi:hypothetical protein
MTETFAAGGTQHLVPPRTLSGSSVGSPPSTGGGMVPAGAEAPVYQPWMEVLAHAESRLKTEVQAALHEMNRTISEAGRLLDAARAIANQQAKGQETAAWTAWNLHMKAAREIFAAVMDPAIRAYTDAVTAAHDRLNVELKPAYAEYKTVVGDATWTRQITSPPSGNV